jgi:hypothetical protein
MLEVLGIKNAQKLIPMDEDQKPTDPVSENQNVLMGKPVKAFMYQDHQAHITVHMNAMQDPKIMQLLQNNPMAGAMQQAMMAHINEHLGFEYRKQIELQLGMSLPPQKDESGEDINMNPEVEARLAPMLAEASQRLLAQNQAQAAQQQAQQQAQDPIIQMQQQELMLKQQEQERKEAKDMADIALKQEQLMIEREKVEADVKKNADKVKFDALKTAATMRNDKEKMVATAGMDLLKAELTPPKQPRKGE